MQKKSLVILLILYLVSTAGTYAVATVLHKKAASSSNGTEQTQQGGANQPAANGQTGPSPLAKLLDINPSDPRDQVCPLNGVKYTQVEKDAWSKRRPLAVMIENSPDARPQSGLTNADIVFEAMAEGGVTRFMALFYCNAQSEDVTLAPVRSAREYFWQLASGFNRPLYVHVGGANAPGPADVLSHIADAGWNGQNDMNQFSIGYPTFVRDYNRIEGKDLATEHTMVTSTEKLWTYAANKRGWTNLSPVATAAQSATPASRKGKKPAPVADTTSAVSNDWKDGYTPWMFQDGTPNAGNVNKISFEFWDGFDEYAIRYEYDGSTNSYKRFLANAPHVDLNNNQQLAVKNAVVMFVPEKGPIDVEKHMLYAVTGTGNALIFQNGQVVKATWTKKDQKGSDDREAELFFTDTATGQPIQFVRGQIWISIVSPTTKVTY